jgi:hypothetical protein
MKTKTGLWIIHRGERVNVYTTRDLKRLQEEQKQDIMINKVKRFLKL